MTTEFGLKPTADKILSNIDLKGRMLRRRYGRRRLPIRTRSVAKDVAVAPIEDTPNPFADGVRSYALDSVGATRLWLNSRGPETSNNLVERLWSAGAGGDRSGGCHVDASIPIAEPVQT